MVFGFVCSTLEVFCSTMVVFSSVLEVFCCAVWSLASSVPPWRSPAPSSRLGGLQFCQFRLGSLLHQLCPGVPVLCWLHSGSPLCRLRPGSMLFRLRFSQSWSIVVFAHFVKLLHSCSLFGLCSRSLFGLSLCILNKLRCTWILGPPFPCLYLKKKLYPGCSTFI